METISKRMIELRIEWLNKALGCPLEPWTKTKTGCTPNLGNFHIDHQLGGYRIEQDGNPIFGCQRMTKRELVNQLEAILVAIKLAREEKHGGAWPLEKK